MGLLSDCHVQVKRILPDDDSVKPQKEGFLTGVGEGGGILSGRECSYHNTLPSPSYMKISNAQQFAIMNNYPQHKRKLRRIQHLIPAEVLP